MKKKMGFVTNSSSASFVLTILSFYDDCESFKSYMKNLITTEYLDNIKCLMTDEQYKYEHQRLMVITDVIKHTGPNTFELSDFTAMLNDVTEDLPKWIIHILVLKALGYVYPFIKEVTLRVEED